MGHDKLREFSERTIHGNTCGKSTLLFEILQHVDDV